MSQRPHTSSIVAETVRAACLDAAMEAYEDAGIRGLCGDGQWEAAVAAIRHLDLSDVLGAMAALPAPTDTAHVTRRDGS